MRKFSPDELAQILEWHKEQWTKGEEGRADLSHSDLRGVDLKGANLAGANFGGADLRGADLSGANLAGANFGGADLRDANLSLTTLFSANFYSTNLSRANLRDANLRKSDLSHANLRDANLLHADLSGAILRYADLSGAAMDGCTLPNREKYEEWALIIQEWLEIPELQIYEWPDGTRVFAKFVPSYPNVGLELETRPNAGQERFFLHLNYRGELRPPIPDSGSKICRVLFDMGLVQESTAEEGTWIYPTPEEMELRHLLDEPHPLLLPSQELKAWMLSALPSRDDS